MVSREGEGEGVRALCCADRSQYTVGTLSQYIGTAAAGYRALPPAPPRAHPAALRDPPRDDTARDTPRDPRDPHDPTPPQVQNNHSVPKYS